MTRYLLDTNIWIYLMRNRPPEVRTRYARLKPGAVLLSPIVLGELHVGWRKSGRPVENQGLLASYIEGAVIDPVDERVAAAYGEIRAELEAQGTPIGRNDLWIAAHARERGCILVTHDGAEFSRVRGLRLQDWVAA